MNYMEIIPMEFNNGKFTGQSLFVSGCHFHCKGCFNPQAWDYNAGKEFTEEVKKKFIEDAKRSSIMRVSILGGEPLDDNNVSEVLSLLKDLKREKKSLIIWVFTGFKIEDIIKPKHHDENSKKRKECLEYIDTLVDGQYDDALHDELLPFRGSSNQRIIDVKSEYIVNTKRGEKRTIIYGILSSFFRKK